MDFEDGKFYYPCPCGDKFQINIKAIIEGADIATCPSCSIQDFIKDNGVIIE
ncbi:hypothetical protein FGO68_gene6427 [Halteria grandinella]|uniref:DPH-type MB domain-containing protein n=1 Tax=Halteria grandinella TaxID=5974 RepID=A0A8J8NGY3_HALGN|nr:hypothetical protein FGO68_gene6427 [Halteria grandinella]